jgi:hypothetical protein
MYNVTVNNVAVSVPMDPYLSLRALAGYSGISVRKLRDHLMDAGHPLPHYQVGGKFLVRRSEFDAWIVAYRQVGRRDVDALVSDVLRTL